MQIAHEVQAMSEVLESDYRNQRIIDIENRVRDNKRTIVNLLSDNIFQIRFGFQKEQEEEKGEKEYIMAMMLAQREKKIKTVEKIFK